MPSLAERVRGFLPGRKGPDTPPVPASPYVHITGLIERGSKIWFDNAGKKVDRFKDTGEELIQKLTPQLLSDPQFYADLTTREHMEAITLLGALVPKKLGEPVPGPIHDLVSTYVNGMASYPPEGAGTDYKDQLATRIYNDSGIPEPYLDKVFATVGLPVKVRPTANFTLQDLEKLAHQR